MERCGGKKTREFVVVAVDQRRGHHPRTEKTGIIQERERSCPPGVFRLRCVSLGEKGGFPEQIRVGTQDAERGRGTERQSMHSSTCLLCVLQP